MVKEALYKLQDTPIIVDHFLCYQCQEKDSADMLPSLLSTEEYLEMLRESHGLSLYGEINFTHRTTFCTLNNPDIGAYFIFHLKCLKEAGVAFTILSGNPIHIYINGELIYGTELKTKHILGVQLKGGINTVIIKFPEINPKYDFSLRVSSYTFEVSEAKDALLNSRHTLQFPPISYLYSIRGQDLLITLFPYDSIEIPLTQEVTLFIWGRLHTLRLKISGRFRQNIRFSLPMNINTSSLELRLSYSDRRGARHDVLLGVLLKKENEIIIQSPQPDVTQSAAAAGSGADLHVGLQDLIFPCTLDGQDEKIHLFLPIHYQKSEKYPLVMCMSITRYSQYADFLKNIRCEEAIYADVTAKGVTGGSYIGEASILEILSLLLKNYSVDLNRIYLLGESNGAFAAWAMAENYPHMFAGVLVASGKPYYKNIRNLMNLPVILITSNKDHMKKQTYSLPRKVLRRYCPYTCIESKNLLHVDLGHLICKEAMLEALFQLRRNPYPDHLYFRTENTRHRRSYWMELHGIAFGATYAVLEAQITQSDTIEIKAIHATGFTIDLPPQIDRAGPIYIRINQAKKPLVLRNSPPTVNFKKGKREGYFFAKDAPSYCTSAEIKGMGILDVYLGPMRIYILPGAGSHVKKSAMAFAHPTSNGTDQTIYIQYPVVTISEQTDWSIRENRIVIFTYDEYCRWIPTLSRLVHDQKISPRENGFFYQGKFYGGNYLILQIHSEGGTNGQSTLLVQTNCADYLSKNIVLRKIILPVYANGFHRYYNNNALILYENRFYGIYEWGQKLTKL